MSTSDERDDSDEQAADERDWGILGRDVLRVPCVNGPSGRGLRAVGLVIMHVHTWSPGEGKENDEGIKR